MITSDLKYTKPRIISVMLSVKNSQDHVFKHDVVIDDSACRNLSYVQLQNLLKSECEKAVSRVLNDKDVVEALVREPANWRVP